MLGKNKPVLLLLLPAASLLLCGHPRKTLPISARKTTAKSGIHYTIISQGSAAAGFTTTRPEKKDSTVFLCIAAAFTNADNHAVNGFHMIRGEGKGSVSKRVGGGVKIVNGRVTLMATDKGTKLSDSLIRVFRKEKASFFQQIMLVDDGVVSKFKDTALFQRRAIVTMNDGSGAVIESYEHIRLARFSADLAELGVRDAVYTDMGGWDEGWYRDPASGQTETIGRLRLQTDLQTNWFIYSK